MACGNFTRVKRNVCILLKIGLMFCQIYFDKRNIEASNLGFHSDTLYIVSKSKVGDLSRG